MTWLQYSSSEVIIGNRATRINIDLGQYNQAWITYRRARGSTPSAMVRLLIVPLLDAGVPQDMPPPPRTDLRRKQVQLSPAEFEHVATAARRAGLSNVRRIVALIRCNMQELPLLSAAELRMLGRSNLALLVIGRNLNQIARALNAGGPFAPAELVAVLGALRV